jgi:ribonuclease P protein component
VEHASDSAARSEALPKFRRLAKRREFLRVYETGRKQFSRFVVVFTATNGLPYSRLGVTATKKLGKANLRNRFKRWTREVYRIERESLGIDRRCVDLVVNVKPNAKDATFLQYQQDLSRAIRRAVSEHAR